MDLAFTVSEYAWHVSQGDVQENAGGDRADEIVVVTVQDSLDIFQHPPLGRCRIFDALGVSDPRVT